MTFGRVSTAVTRLLGASCLAVGLATVAPTASMPVGAAPFDLQTADDSDVEWRIGEEPIVLDTRSTRTSFDVRVPTGFRLSSSAELEVGYRHPELLDSASLIVSVNGRLVDAVELSTSSGTIRLAIAASFFDRVDNTVSIEASLLVDGDPPCSVNPARSIELDASSSLTAPVRAKSSIAFPFDFEPLGSNSPVVEVAFDGEPDSAEVTAAAELLGALRDVSSLIFDVAVVSADDAMGTHPRISVAVDASAGSTSSELTTAGDAPLLELTSNDGDDLIAAAHDLATGNFEPSIRSAPNDAFTLADIGYDDRTLRGPGSDSTLFVYDVAAGSTPTMMTVAVDAVRSASSSSVEGVSLVVNGRRVGAVSFGPTGSTADVAPIRVQGSDLRPGRNTLKFAVDFDGEAVDCDAPPPSQEVTIAATTSIDLRIGNESIDLDLDDLPYTFRHPADTELLTVVLPDEPTSSDAAAAVNLAGLLGAAGQTVTVSKPDELTAADRTDRHLVVIGGADRQSLLDWFEENGDTAIASASTWKTGQQIPIGTPNSVVKSLSGVIEIFANPANDERIVISVGGRTDEGTQLATEAVLDRTQRSELRGASTLVGLADDELRFTGDTRPASLARSGDIENQVSARLDARSSDDTNAADAPSRSTPSTSLSTYVDDEANGNGSVRLAAGGAAAGLAVAAGAVHLARRRDTDDD